MRLRSTTSSELLSKKPVLKMTKMSMKNTTLVIMSTTSYTRDSLQIGENAMVTGMHRPLKIAVSRMNPSQYPRQSSVSRKMHVPACSAHH